MSKSVFVGIGNTDDKLGQDDWASFIEKVHDAINDYADQMHFNGFSAPTAWWQNAGWLFDIEGVHTGKLTARLHKLAGEFGQDSVCWLEGETEFLRPLEALSSEQGVEGQK